MLSRALFKPPRLGGEGGGGYICHRFPRWDGVEWHTWPKEDGSTKEEIEIHVVTHNAEKVGNRASLSSKIASVQTSSGNIRMVGGSLWTPPESPQFETRLSLRHVSPESRFSFFISLRISAN